MSFRVMTLERLGQFAEAESVGRESVRIAQSPKSTLSASEVRGFIRRYATSLVLNGKAAEGLQWFDKLIAQEDDAGQKDTRHAASLMLRAGALTALGRGQEAAHAGEQAIEAWKQSGASLGALGRIGLARAELNTALGWITAKSPAQAEPLITQAEGLLRESHTGPHPDLEFAALVRAQWLRASGRVAEGDAAEHEARKRYRELSGAEAPQPLHFTF
jgi:tetratricopeptide (TPR) repeat protein